MKYLLAIILSLTRAVSSTSQAGNEVNAPDGTFVGIVTQTGRQFLGIPYAAAPVGELRWAPPKVLSTKPQRFVAQKIGSVCVQPVNSGNLNPKPGDPMGVTSWLPIYGTKIIPQDGRAYAIGDFNRVPVINGSNRDEGRLFAAGYLQQGFLKSAEEYERNLRAQYGARADKVLAQYPVSNYSSVALAFAASMTDWLFAWPALSANEAMSRHTQVYAYEFNDRKAPYAAAVPKDIQSLGAYHAAEIQYIFQTRSVSFTDPAKFTPDQKRLADRMQEAWVSFARDGVPAIKGEEPWTPVRPGKISIKNFDTGGAPYVSDFADYHKCSFWSSL